MGYETASTNVWPITHPDGTAFKIDGTDMVAADQVGKYWGERYEGNVAGVTCATSGEGRMVWEFDVDNYVDAEAKGLQIPEGYARVTAVYVEVEENFDAGDVTVDIGGTTVLAGTPVPIDGVDGMFAGTLTATDIDRTINSGEDVTINVTGVTGIVGKAKVIVEFTRV